MKTSNQIQFINMPADELINIIKKIITEYSPVQNIITSNNIDDKMNQKEAAKFLGLCESTMVKYKKIGILPYHQVPGSALIVYYKSELIEFMRRSPEYHKPSRK